MFAIELLPAGRGDCILLEYGEPGHPSRVLIDGGPKPCYAALRQRILTLPKDNRHFDLLVVTHIDLDHIQGILELLREKDNLGVTFHDVWFNGFHHLPPPGQPFGPLQGEELIGDILAQGLPWNLAFRGGAVAVPEDGALPRISLPGGMKLTLLSPTPTLLTRLWPKWQEAVTNAGLIPGVAPAPPQPEDPGLKTLAVGLNLRALAALPFKVDRSEANCSSIAFIAEFEGKCCLLTGDAFPTTLAASVQRLGATNNNRLPLAAFKPSHHGSRGSLNNDLLRFLDCNRYLISTDGSYYEHPHDEATARIIVHGGGRPRLCFNYRSPYNSGWDDIDLMREYGYEVMYPSPAGSERLRLEL
jgi:hypothetical protein